MTTVTIAAEKAAGPKLTFRAFAKDRQATGQTPGAALDALAAEIDLDANGSLVVFLEPRHDEFFTAEQSRRLRELVVQHRAALDAGLPMPPADLAELEDLALAETEASGLRVEAVLRRVRV